MKVSDLKHDRLYLFRYRGYALIGKADLMINHRGDNIRGFITTERVKISVCSLIGRNIMTINHCKSFTNMRSQYQYIK
ncbi:hypothetical protein [Vibrio phage phiKT1024]|nr:hypothetical protein [Vibrio phage phiKT1024]